MKILADPFLAHWVPVLSPPYRAFVAFSIGYHSTHLRGTSLFPPTSLPQYLGTALTASYSVLNALIKSTEVPDRAQYTRIVLRATIHQFVAVPSGYVSSAIVVTKLSHSPPSCWAGSAIRRQFSLFNIIHKYVRAQLRFFWSVVTSSMTALELCPGCEWQGLWEHPHRCAAAGRPRSCHLRRTRIFLFLFSFFFFPLSFLSVSPSLLGDPLSAYYSGRMLRPHCLHEEALAAFSRLCHPCPFLFFRSSVGLVSCSAKGIKQVPGGLYNSHDSTSSSFPPIFPPLLQITYLSYVNQDFFEHPTTPPRNYNIVSRSINYKDTHSANPFLILNKSTEAIVKFARWFALQFLGAWQGWTSKAHLSRSLSQCRSTFSRNIPTSSRPASEVDQ